MGRESMGNDIGHNIFQNKACSVRKYLGMCSYKVTKMDSTKPA